MPQAPSLQQLLSMVPESQIDRFIRQLSPGAVQALKQLETAPQPPSDTVIAEIANAVWACLEAD
jgi:lipase chaperone LimK